MVVSIETGRLSIETSLVAQWLRLHTCNADDKGSVLG